MKVHPYLHLIRSAFRTYHYTSVSLAPDSAASTISVRALCGLLSNCKTVMTAYTRRTGEARGIYYRAKGPPVCLYCLSDWLAGWLVGRLAVHQYYYCCCCHGPPQQSLAGLLKPVLELSQQPVCSTPLIYVHWRWCKVVEKLYGITACPAPLPSYSNSKVGEGRQKDGGMNEGRG